MLKPLAAALAVSVALSAPGAVAQTRHDVTQVVATTSFAFMPVYVAMHAGFFEEEGVDLEVITASSAQAGIAMVASGEASYYLSTPVAGARSAAQGAAVTNCGALMTQNPTNIVISGEVAERIDLPDDPSTLSVEERMGMLRDLRMAAHTPGSSPDQTLRFMALQAGMDPERDFEILPIAGRPILAALEQGRIDGFAFSSPLADTAVIQQGARKLFSLADGSYEPLSGMLSISMVCSKDWVENETEAAAATLRAIWRAMELMRDDPAAAKQAARQQFADLDERIFEAAFETNLRAFPDNPRISQDQIEQAIEFNENMGGAELDAAPEDVYTNVAVDMAESTRN